jgi:hypothetical protein
VEKEKKIYAARIKKSNKFKVKKIFTSYNSALCVEQRASQQLLT